MRVDLLGVDVGDVGPVVRRGPGDLAVVADQGDRGADVRGAGHVELGAFQVRLVPEPRPPFHSSQGGASSSHDRWGSAWSIAWPDALRSPRDGQGVRGVRLRPVGIARRPHLADGDPPANAHARGPEVDGDVARRQLPVPGPLLLGMHREIAVDPVGEGPVVVLAGLGDLVPGPVHGLRDQERALAEVLGRRRFALDPGELAAGLEEQPEHGVEVVFRLGVAAPEGRRGRRAGVDVRDAPSVAVDQDFPLLDRFEERPGRPCGRRHGQHERHEQRGRLQGSHGSDWPVAVVCG